VSRSPLATSTRAPRRSSDRNRGGEKIVGFVARALCVGETAGGYELWNCRELLDHVIVERAPALIGRECFMAIGRRFVGVPSDQHGARLLLAIEPQQEIGETQNGTGRLVVLAANAFRQRVTGAMRK
jgi:hypothetical protein